MAQNPNMVAIPFALVGFFATDKPIEEVINTDLTPEELEEIQQYLAKKLFKDPNVVVAIYPAIVPPEQATEAVKELENILFSEE
ncbi:MAG: hypothetical protein GXN97_01510 [Aquificae bacterium]|jgi:hypothetical protein|nr:hypothetical protein [Aquificota bacterium]